MLECPICRNTKAAETCEHCNRRGTVKISVCPMKFVGQRTWTMASLARFADKSAFPVSGGVLDQTESFLQFYERWNSTLNRLKAEAGNGE